jgi:hypothetical protein
MFTYSPETIKAYIAVLATVCDVLNQRYVIKEKIEYQISQFHYGQDIQPSLVGKPLYSERLQSLHAQLIEVDENIALSKRFHAHTIKALWLAGAGRWKLTKESNAFSDIQSDNY